MTRFHAICLTVLLFAGVYYFTYGQQEPYVDPVDTWDACFIKTVPYNQPLTISEPQGGAYGYTLIAGNDGIEVWRTPCKQHAQ